MKHWLRLTIWTLALAGVATTLPAMPASQAYDRANAAGKQLIVQTRVAALQAVTAQYGLQVVGNLPGDDADLAVVEGPAGMGADQVADLIRGDADVLSAEPVVLASLPARPAAGGAGLGTAGAAAVWQNGVHDTLCLSQGFTDPPWSGYSDQGAVQLVRLHAAQAASPSCGAVRVAVLDTGVDPDHPALTNALVPGYDFLLERHAEASEWTVPDHSVMPIVEQVLRAAAASSQEAVVAGQGTVIPLEAAMGIILDPTVSIAAIADDLPPYFGHGTMVAGLVRLAAPAAEIMPLKVFDAEGRGHLFDIVRAIYFAVDNGADVINMSFSVEAPSQALQQALQYARRNGVVLVAAAGNRASSDAVYPAAYADAVGVAATTLQDELSDFSNYGQRLVELAAPGDGVISTFPGGLYAAGWGTSFSAPLVAGAAALLHPGTTGSSNASAQHRTHALIQGSVRLPDLSTEIGSGRLDALTAVLIAAD